MSDGERFDHIVWHLSYHHHLNTSLHFSPVLAQHGCPYDLLACWVHQYFKKAIFFVGFKRSSGMLHPKLAYFVATSGFFCFLFIQADTAQLGINEDAVWCQPVLTGSAVVFINMLEG